ncbi:MAG: Wadjet anti-phage system protein JetD domain-containing protein [Owenweeksia sp.]
MNWIALKSLNEIHTSGKTRIKETLKKSSEIQYLLETTNEIYASGKHYYPGEGFTEYYLKHHSENFGKYSEFLSRNELLKPQTRFEETDIKILMGIEERMANGDLIPIRDQMIKAEESVRGVSSMFFHNEKYLLGKPSLIDSVKQLLDIEELADDKDQQYMYRLECLDPQMIVLCENLDFLKKPTAPRKHNIELWYAGGKNIAKLEFSDTRNLPIYYSCDWDHDGLLIFGMVREKIPGIKLLFPNAASKDITTSDHDSHWQNRSNPEQLSNLDSGLFLEQEKNLIKSLIVKDHWITEEDNDLVRMIKDL